MIVKCTGCQARFRVADDKVGPRGARVRCSKCQTVFVVKRDAPVPPPPAPKIDLDLTPGLRRPSPGRGQPSPSTAGAAVIPFPVTSPSRPPPPDPFAAAGLDAFGEAAPAGDDPFARVAGPPAGPGAGLAAVASEPSPALDDPFAAVPAVPAYGGLSSGTTGAQSLAVTDLSQLLGTPAPPSPAAAPPPPAASALASPLPPDPVDPFAQPVDEPQLGFEPQLGMELPGLEQLAGAGPQLDADPQRAAGSLAPDLALEETSGSHQAPFADPADVMMSAAPGSGSFDGAAFEAGLPGGLSASEEPLALATEPTPGPVAAEVEPDPPPMRGPPPEPAAQPVEPPAVAAGPGDAEAEDRRQAGLAGVSAAHRLRAAAVNALALVALLAIALAFRVVLRGEASIGPSALRPSTLLRALRGEARGAGGFEVAEVRSGVYSQSSGGAVLFVRGEVVSRALRPVGAVRVEAELVRDGQVLARGEIRAGAVPTPEEIDQARDRAALDALAAELRKRAPGKVAPGDRLAFLVPLGDAPADVSGTSVRVRAEAEDAGK
jgi:predicted Zn finger-like uncharacterized protein